METLSATCDYVFERLESFSAAANEVVNTEAVKLSRDGALQPRRAPHCYGSLQKLQSPHDLLPFLVLAFFFYFLFYFAFNFSSAAKSLPTCSGLERVFLQFPFCFSLTGSSTLGQEGSSRGESWQDRAAEGLPNLIHQFSFRRRRLRKGFLRRSELHSIKAHLTQFAFSTLSVVCDSLVHSCWLRIKMCGIFNEWLVNHFGN